MTVSNAREPAASGAGGGSEGRRELAAMLAACVLAAVGLQLAFHGKSTRFEDLALGKQTTGVFASVDGAPIHCLDAMDFPRCAAGFERRGRHAAGLWLGNSQLHGVNQWSSGQETAPALLARQLRADGIDLLAVSPPNGNFREHLVLYALARSRLPLRLVLLPAVFDDLRDASIRTTITPALSDPGAIRVLGSLAPGRHVLQANESTADPDRRALDQTVQERTEASLEEWLESRSALWALRPQARGELFSRLYQLRNSVFGIRPDTKRRLIEGSYALNLAALEAILEDAAREGIRVVTYVAPLRDDIEIPYVEKEYARFKGDAERLARRHGAVFANFEGIVPAALWGVKRATTVEEESEVDFMHFQAGGHSILATRLVEVLDGHSPRASR